MGSKRFKDPLYGYIEVEEGLIDKVIDTAGFQRLRNIIQTSYSPLYASALHNRFTHSIGVYHLGRIAVQALEKSCTPAIIHSFPDIQEYFKVFEKASESIGEKFFYLYYTRNSSNMNCILHSL